MDLKSHFAAARVQWPEITGTEAKQARCDPTLKLREAKMGERDDRITVVDTGTGGGAVIAGILTAALVLLGPFFLFGDHRAGLGKLM